MTVSPGHPEYAAPPDVRTVEITRESVELFKILKFEGMVASGGEAKTVIAGGQVLVNGKTEIRKRKKIVAGDTIEFNNEKIAIKLAPSVSVDASLSKTADSTQSDDNSAAIEVEKA